MLCALLYLSKDCILRGVSVFKYSFILLKFSLFYVQYVDIFLRIAKKCVHLQKDLMLIRKTYSMPMFLLSMNDGKMVLLRPSGFI